MHVNYSYTRTTDLFGNFTGRITPRVGVTLADYAPGSGFSGHAAGRHAATTSPTFIPNAAKVAAGGNGFATTNIPGYSTDYHGLELSLVKRLSNRWMARVGVLVEQRPRALRQRGRHLRHQRQPDADAQRAAEGRRPVRAAERRQRLPAASTSTRSGSSTPTRCTRRRTGSRSAATCSGGRAIRSRCSGRARPRRSAATRRSGPGHAGRSTTFRYAEPVEHRPARGAHRSR